MPVTININDYDNKIREIELLSPMERLLGYREWCRNDLYFLMRYAMNRPFMERQWFFDRCREVEANPDGYLDLWAREHGKSLTITIGKTIQDILIDPEVTIGLFSHTRPIAKSFLRVVKREFENNDLLKEWFPDILYDNPVKESDKWSEDQGIIVKRFNNPAECTMEAHGLVDGMPTGRHFSLRVYDDVVTGDSVSTAEQIQKTTDALDMSNNLGQIGGRVRMIGTRYCLGDSYDEYLKRGKIKPRIKPATDNGRVDGNAVFFTQEQWEDKLKDMSPAIIASQMLQNPLASDVTIFQPDWFQLWPGDKELPYFDMVFLSLDGAFSEKSSADDSCLGALGVFKAAEGSGKYSVMVLDNYMEKVAYPELRDEVIRQYGNKFGKNDKDVDGIIIENKASGSALIPELRKAGIAVYAYNPGSLDKTSRANLVSHLVRDGYLWLPESRIRKGYPMTWASKLYEQLIYFPNSRLDDGVDMVVQGLSMLDKMGFLRGKMVPPRSETYWQKAVRGNYG